eukprot:4130979-Pleurochrysis_carterae.AAC.1
MQCDAAAAMRATPPAVRHGGRTAPMGQFPRMDGPKSIHHCAEWTILPDFLPFSKLVNILKNGSFPTWGPTYIPLACILVYVYALPALSTARALRQGHQHEQSSLARKS